MFRRFTLLIVSVSLALFGATAHAAYPDKPIRLIVPWAPVGSPTPSRAPSRSE